MFSPLFLLTLTLSVIATSPSPSPPTLNTTDLSQHHPSRIAPRFISGGFYEKCKDVRFYLAKADDTHPRKNSFNGYKSSPWLVAKCPNKNGEYLYVAVGAVDGYLTCHGNWGILDYCSGRPSHDPFLDSK
ncbi:hypothetical protein QWA68_002023 [Fusarium oxysporum]|nr:hypothetical protein QWA68_002023 [Fusarium oxysporum]